MNPIALLLCIGLLQASPQPAAQDAKHAFPKLKPAEQEKVDQALFLMRTAKTDATRAEARASLQECGAGAVPSCLKAFAKFEGERVDDLRGALDQLLVENDLDLALVEAGPKAPPAARVYVARRIADSGRADAGKLLQPLLADADAELAYQAARGLALRGDSAAVKVLHATFKARWKDQEKLLRQDLEKVPRGPLSAAAAALVQAGQRDDRLAAIRLFSLVGVKEQAKVLRPALDDPDQQILLNAVNACRAVVNGEPPLDRPSSPQIIEQVQLWKSKL